MKYIDLKERPKERWIEREEHRTLLESYSYDPRPLSLLHNPSISPPYHTSVPVPSPDTLALMAVGQSQLEKVIYEIDRGAGVSQLEDEHMMSTQERTVSPRRYVSPPSLPVLGAS